MAAATSGGRRSHVGRSVELARALSTVREGRGAVLAGVAGVGKSHLLDLVTAQLAGDGWSPLTARGDPARRQPFAAFGDLLPSIAGDPDRWALVLRRGLDHLVGRAGPGRPVLVADDLHAFDPASAALVQQAVLDGRLRLVGTLRVGEPALDAVTALWKHDLVDRLEVGPLTRAESAELAELLVGGPIDDATRARLWTWTEGNPLLLTEIVEQSERDGTWRPGAGLWRLDAVPTGSPRLAGLLDERVAGCPPAVADLVDAVALAGHLPMALADGLVGRAAMATAERLRLVRVRTDQGRPGVMLDHPLYGELRLAATTGDRRATLRHRLLDVVERLDIPAPTTRAPSGDGTPADPGDPDGIGAGLVAGLGGEIGAPDVGAADLALVAQWYLETGRVGPRTSELLIGAAERSWAGNDPGRAAALARRAWHLRPDDRSGHLLVSALARNGATEELEAVAPRVATDATSDRVRAQAVLTHALALFQFTNRPDVGRAILADGAHHVAAPGWRDVLRAEIASYTLQMGDVAGAEAMAAPLMASPNPRAAADAAAVVGPARALQGRIAASITAADQGLALASSLTEDFVDTGQYLFHKLTALVDDGQVSVAEELALAAVGEPSLVDPFARGFVALSLGRVLRLRGRPRSAARWFREAAAALDSVQRVGFASWCFAGLAAVLAEVGDRDGAEAAAERCARHDDHPIRVGTVEVRRSLAWVAVARGDHAGAAAALDEAVEQGLASRELVHAGHALHDLVRLDRSHQAIDRLMSLRSLTDSALLAVYADHARAVVDGDRAGVVAAAEAFEALGCDLSAAEAWHEASRAGAPEGSGPAEVRVAAARRRSAALAGRCEGATTPLLAHREPLAVLSDREREIARMAAEGSHRRDIATRLVISPRTVDSHLQRIYRKLGITGHRALGGVLDELDGD